MEIRTTGEKVLAMRLPFSHEWNSLYRAALSDRRPVGRVSASKQFQSWVSKIFKLVGDIPGAFVKVEKIYNINRYLNDLWFQGVLDEHRSEKRRKTEEMQAPSSWNWDCSRSIMTHLDIVTLSRFLATCRELGPVRKTTAGMYLAKSKDHEALDTDMFVVQLDPDLVDEEWDDYWEEDRDPFQIFPVYEQVRGHWVVRSADILYCHIVDYDARAITYRAILGDFLQNLWLVKSHAYMTSRIQLAAVPPGIGAPALHAHHANILANQADRAKFILKPEVEQYGDCCPVDSSYVFWARDGLQAISLIYDDARLVWRLASSLDQVAEWREFYRPIGLTPAKFHAAHLMKMHKNLLFVMSQSPYIYPQFTSPPLSITDWAGPASQDILNRRP